MGKNNNMKENTCFIGEYNFPVGTICIIIPCHRVVGANNQLVGYGGGIENKIKLLKLEHVLD